MHCNDEKQNHKKREKEIYIQCIVIVAEHDYKNHKSRDLYKKI